MAQYQDHSSPDQLKLILNQFQGLTLSAPSLVLNIISICYFESILWRHFQSLLWAKDVAFLTLFTAPGFARVSGVTLHVSPDVSWCPRLRGAAPASDSVSRSYPSSRPITSLPEASEARWRVIRPCRTIEEVSHSASASSVLKAKAVDPPFHPFIL